jgi:hypothetical protein
MTLRLQLLILCSFLTFSLFAQLDFKIQLMPDGTKWGIYVTPQPGTVPSTNTITGSGQITMVAPLGFTVVDFNPVSGFWANNAVINGPVENPTKSYISFGLMSDDPQIKYSTTSPTLLFTFRKAANYCPDELYLIENGVDPFDQLPNSANSNPGNEITVLDFGTTPFSTYNYGENIAPFAWDCHDCDGDGIPNALEDTNGNGVYDPTIDVSDLCNNTGGGCLEITGANLQCQGGGTACGDNPPGQISLVVNVAGGEAPYAVKYTNGSDIFTIQNYQSGTPFNVDATSGAVYSLIAVTGNDLCEAEGNTLTGEVPVTFPSLLEIVSHPENGNVCAGEGTLFSACATASNASFSFTWQYSANNGATWLPVPLGNIFSQTNTGTITDGCDELLLSSTTGLNGYRFRAVASGNGVATIYSTPATLTVNGPLLVATEPQSVNVCAGDAATFAATVSNSSGSAPISYQWQTSTDGGLTWSSVADNAIFSGSTSATLNIASTTSADNAAYRLQVQVGNCPAQHTLPAELTVEGPVEINSLQGPAVVCRGEAACFEVQAELQGSGQLSYQWQERPTGSATWTNVQGATEPTFCLANSEGRNGYCYRALVRTASCSAVTSVEACLIVEDKAVFAQQPQSPTLCDGETATLTANAAIAAGYAGQVDFRWQTSADGGQSWQDLDNDAIFAGAHSNTLTINDLAGLDGLRYRLSASAGVCETTYSDAATVNVEGPIEITVQPVDVAICPGTNASFTAATNLLGAGNLQLQWQTSTDGTVWTNTPENAVYTGSQTGTLTVQNATASRLFRLSASTGVCGAKYTEPATMSVEAPIVFTEQPESATVCPDDAASFAIAVGGGSGTLSLQWQSSANGQVWADVANGGIYAGAQTSTLTISEAAGLQNMQFRLVAASQNCTKVSAPAVLSLEDDAICNPAPEYNDCVSLAVKKLDGNIGWSVWVKAADDFTETPYQLPTSGRVTLVAPVGFAFQGLTSFNGGKWKPGKVAFSPTQDPGKVYVEFNLTPNQNFLELTPGGERLLFSFSVVNGCPSSLSLMDQIVPPGFLRNDFTGFGAGLTAEDIPFHACGIYGQETWVCPPTMNLMGPAGGSGVANGQSLDLDPSAVQVDFGKDENVEVQPSSFFGVAPNPVRDELTVAFDENMLDKTASLRLWNLQGQLLQQETIQGEATRRLNMGNTLPGIYFLTLEVDGKLVQREKVIVQ